MSEYIVGEHITDFTAGHINVREPIVRCRDCEWLVETSNPISSTGLWCVTNDTPRELDGFCNWAIRRAD